MAAQGGPKRMRGKSVKIISTFSNPKTSVPPMLGAIPGPPKAPPPPTPGRPSTSVPGMKALVPPKVARTWAGADHQQRMRMRKRAKRLGY